MHYVDVILPLPLEGTFTYSVPEPMVAQVRMGVRVLVPLGRSKTYTAMAVRLHSEKPEFETRPIIQVIDAEPVLIEQQLRLWQWISTYYMSPIGDVFKAALPAGLKAEENYRPKTVRCVTLPANLRSEQSLHMALTILKRALKQHQTFSTYLQLSHWSEIDGETPPAHIAEIACDELQNAANASDAVLRQLIQRNFLELYHREVGRLNTSGEYHPERIQPLSPAQQAAEDSIQKQFNEKNVVLLHGVTSSGKTEIYIHLIKKAIYEGKQVLYLLPEIALTVQMTRRLHNVFGSRLGIYHSKYSDAERVEIWKKQLSSEPYDVILGARSAVFLPFTRLGFVIVDEEHETSFKQQDPAPRYHARSTAIMLARMYEGAKVLLGTATPSMESYHNACTGKYGYVQLTTRYKDVAMPEIRVVDTKDLYHRKMMRGAFSPDLLEAMRTALRNKKQVLLFQNRRGFAPMVECKVCGWVPKCKNCDVSLTYHRSMNLLTCHYCGYTYPVPKQCPNCESTELLGRGYGTEKIEDRVRELFPEARIARMDLDTTRSAGAYGRIIDDFSCGRTDILIGTQMITKGLDFSGVTVVGILNADTMLNYPDFRAYEQAFQMLSQVSGRAGRRDERGLVILQTKSADLPVIQQVVAGDFQTFACDLLEERSMFRYPPFYHLVYVYLRHRNEQLVDSAAIEMASRLRQAFADRVLGPDKPAVARVKTESIRKIVIKLEQGINLPLARQCMAEARTQLLQDKRYAAMTVFFDVDPS
ncbi:replication restart helicase PriA [Leyella stercorea]|uniref:Replication restart protein PriA n=1 Tax=Leyella stercorea CAG:629 TaxID=1263103 RepID=R7H3G3_9BACT|nr:primosomal protein N' [Leyella stercorea]CDE33543.1 primosomal protein [Leyella stercorea CAG:629]